MAYFLIGRLALITLLLSIFAAGVASGVSASSGTFLGAFFGLIGGALDRLPDLAQTLILLGAATTLSAGVAWPLARFGAERPETLFSRLLRLKTALGPAIPTFILLVGLGIVDRTGWIWPGEAVAQAGAAVHFAIAIVLLGFSLLPAAYIAFLEWRFEGQSPTQTAALRLGFVVPGIIVVEALMLGSGLGARLTGEFFLRNTEALGASLLLALAAILLVAGALEAADRVAEEAEI